MTGRSTRPASAILVQRLDELGRISDDRERLTRTFLSPAMRRANATVAAWMRQAGLAVHVDPVGNLRGRLASSRPGAKTLLLGSHLDTVREAGRFDGALGVLLPITVLAELRRVGGELPFSIEVIGFSEEEGIRFSSAYLGSKGFAGRLQRRELALRDDDGRSLRDVLERFQGGPVVLPQPAYAPRELLGYCEVHIEQGPVLESANLAVGVVSAIVGQTRGRIAFRGQAGHAGTTPMSLRRDALAGAAEYVLMAENFARATDGLVATIGALHVEPGAPNVIPAAVELSLDVRHPHDAARRAAMRELTKQGAALARRRELRWEWQQTQDQDAVVCSRELSGLLEQSVRAVQTRSMSLASGAGHDAVVLSAHMPVAMLFVRCRHGLSHHPDEYASPADIDVAVRVMIDFVLRLAHVHRR